MDENTEAAATLYRVDFERIGRNHSVPPMHVSGHPDDMAEAVHKVARGYLGSRWYSTSVDLEACKVYIEGGRFGEGTLTAVSA